jgi:hypothetical protein
MGQQYKEDAIMLGLVLHEKQRRDAIQAASRGQPDQQPPVNEQVVQSLGPQQQQQMPPPQQGQGPMPPQQGPQGPMPPQQGPQGPMPPQQGQGPMPPQRMADGGMTGLPEDSGIGALPAPNIERMAEGGIASFAEAGAVKQDPKTAFIEQYKPYAAKAGQELGIDPALILSQWGLETAWGTKTVGDYNFGNIKDVTNKGPKALDKAENSRSAYKEYASPDAFVTDYTNLIKTNFPKAVGAGSDISTFSSGLKSGRVGAYATDPDYGKKLATTAQTLGDVAPADQAVAATPSVPAKTFENSTGNERVLGALDAARSVGSGLVALPLSAAYGLYQKAISGENEDVAAKRAQQAITYGPSTGAGEDILSGLGGVADFLHLPAYTPGMQAPGVAGANRARLARTSKAAEQAVEDVKKAQVATYSGPAQGVGPQGPIQLPPAGPRNPGAMGNQYRSLEAQKYNAELQRTQGVLGNAADIAAREQAMLARAKTLSGDVRNTGTRAAGIAALSGAVPPIVAGGEGANRAEAEAAADRENRPAYETDIHRPPFANMPDKAKDILADAAKKSVPAAERRSMGFTGDDWTMLGLQMLANPSPYFLQTVGKAGVATLANIQQQKQLETERKYHEALSGKATAESGKAAAETKFLESGSRTEKTISDEAIKLLDVWKTNNIMAKTPEIIAAYQQFYKQVASNYPGYKQAPSPTAGFTSVRE